MTDAQLDEHLTRCQQRYNETGKVPAQHFPGICVTLTGKECSGCAAFRVEVRNELTKMVTALDQMIEAE